MAKYVDSLINVLISLVIFGALFPVINTQLTTIGLDNITVAGTSYDFSWAAYIIVLGLLFGVVYLGINQFKNKGR